MKINITPCILSDHNWLNLTSTPTEVTWGNWTALNWRTTGSQNKGKKKEKITKDNKQEYGEKGTFAYC